MSKFDSIKSFFSRFSWGGSYEEYLESIISIDSEETEVYKSVDCSDIDEELENMSMEELLEFSEQGKLPEQIEKKIKIAEIIEDKCEAALDEIRESRTAALEELSKKEREIELSMLTLHEEEKKISVKKEELFSIESRILDYEKMVNIKAKALKEKAQKKVGDRNDDDVEKIKQYIELRDIGIISEEEFQKLKLKILGL